MPEASGGRSSGTFAKEMLTFFYVAGYAFKVSAILILISAALRLTARSVKALPFIFIAVSLISLSAYIWEAVHALSHGPYQRAAFEYRLSGPYWPAYWIMFLSTCIIPNLFWIPKLRNSISGLIAIPLLSLLLPYAEFSGIIK